MTRVLNATTARRFFATILAAALLPVGALAGPCDSAGGCFILEAPPGQIPAIAQAHGLIVLEELAGNHPHVVLVAGPESSTPAATEAQVLADAAVTGFEALAAADLPEQAMGALAAPGELAGLSATGEADGGISGYFAAELWNGYADQAAAHLLGLPALHGLPHAEALGAGVVAILDTGVDPDHPLLQGALVAGYDFLRDEAGVPSEWNGLDPAERQDVEDDLRSVADQSYTTILEGGGQALQIDASIAVITDGEVPQVDPASLPAAFGHGTMVAGLVRLAAPAARIMPLRVFDGDGTADLFDVIQAIYYAADNGADVINMSFSVAERSRELQRAVQYAQARGVVCVSSAGNTGDATLTYPAAFQLTVGVASTNLADEPSLFTSYGADLVTLAAPGEEVVSIYPGGGYAVGSGTSFSSALVAGTVAVLHRLDGGDLTTIRFQQAEDALEASAEPVDAAALGLLPEDLGSGRLDAYGAFGLGLRGF